jgi:hypothetical protein
VISSHPFVKVPPSPSILLMSPNDSTGAQKWPRQ